MTTSIVLTKDIDAVKPLFERYMRHMKQFVEVDDEQAWICRANEYFSLYGEEPRKRIYVVRSDSELFGFALVDKSFRFNAEGSAIVDFYIAPEVQRMGYGSRLARHAFSQHPGLWEVCVYSANTSAGVFWERVISDYTSGDYQVQCRDTYDGKGFTFDTSLQR